MKDALDVCALMQGQMDQNEYVRESYALEGRVRSKELTMKQYTAMRNGPFLELKAQEDAILARSQKK